MGSIRACWGTVDPFAQAEFATDSPLEGDGFEPSVPRRKTRVLLVDDEEVTRCLIRQLAPRGIYDVREAKTGAQAWRSC
jgi:PleD family two-component response regulator